MTLPKLTESVIRAGANAQSFQRGQDYYESGAISNTARQGHILTGECEGTSAPYYRVHVELDEAGIREANCTCPYEYGGYCKHIVALLLAYVHHPRQFTVRKEPADLLAALVTALLKRQPELYDWIEGAISAPVPSGKKGPRARKKWMPKSIGGRFLASCTASTECARPKPTGTSACWLMACAR